MRVTISAGSSDNIDNMYKDESRKLLEYLADKGCILNWGSGSIGIMGICYDEFTKKGNEIYGYTSPKYADDIDNLPNAKHVIYPDTFELKKNIFTDGELIICLPGGTGTVSEFFAYIEEIRSNDKPKKLVIYNVGNWFTPFKEAIDSLVAKGFNSTSIYNVFDVVDNFEDFKTYFENL